jgi:hypothetical protein
VPWRPDEGQPVVGGAGAPRAPSILMLQTMRRGVPSWHLFGSMGWHQVLLRSLVHKWAPAAASSSGGGAHSASVQRALIKGDGDGRAHQLQQPPTDISMWSALRLAPLPLLTPTPLIALWRSAPGRERQVLRVRGVVHCRSQRHVMGSCGLREHVTDSTVKAE